MYISIEDFFHILAHDQTVPEDITLILNIDFAHYTEKGNASNTLAVILHSVSTVRLSLNCLHKFLPVVLFSHLGEGENLALTGNLLPHVLTKARNIKKINLI